MRRTKDQDDQLFYKTNNYHDNINLIVEINPSNTGKDITPPPRCNTAPPQNETKLLQNHQKYLKYVNVTL